MTQCWSCDTDIQAEPSSMKAKYPTLKKAKGGAPEGMGAALCPGINGAAMLGPYVQSELREAVLLRKRVTSQLGSF